MGSMEVAVVGNVVESVDGDDSQVGCSDEGSIERLTTGRVAARGNQRGMVSAEWAVGIIAAVALAGVLIAVVTNGPVQKALLGFVLQVIKSFSSYIIG